MAFVGRGEASHQSGKVMQIFIMTTAGCQVAMRKKYCSTFQKQILYLEFFLAVCRHLGLVGFDASPDTTSMIGDDRIIITPLDMIKLY